MSEFTHVAEILAHWEARQPDAIALRFAGTDRTWAQLAQRVRRNVAAQRAAGLVPGDRIAVVGAPSYFERHPAPQTPQDLTAHTCINIRMPTYVGVIPWEFEKDGRELKVRVEGQLVFNNVALRTASVLSGLGLAYMPEDLAMPYIADGRLVRVLEDWCAPFPGYHLYYPSRHHSSQAFALLVDALRYRAG